MFWDVIKLLEICFILSWFAFKLCFSGVPEKSLVYLSYSYCTLYWYLMYYVISPFWHVQTLLSPVWLWELFDILFTGVSFLNLEELHFMHIHINIQPNIWGDPLQIFRALFLFSELLSDNLPHKFYLFQLTQMPITVF